MPRGVTDSHLQGYPSETASCRAFVHRSVATGYQAPGHIMGRPSIRLFCRRHGLSVARALLLFPRQSRSRFEPSAFKPPPRQRRWAGSVTGIRNSPGTLERTLCHWVAQGSAHKYRIRCSERYRLGRVRVRPRMAYHAELEIQKAHVMHATGSHVTSGCLPKNGWQRGEASPRSWPAMVRDYCNGGVEFDW